MKDKIYKHGHGGNDAEHQAHQADITALLEGHTSLKRETEHLPNGIRTCTTSDDPELARILLRHAEDMKARFTKGRAIRSWDPLFEPPRILRRLLFPREWSHDETTQNPQIFPRNP